MHNFYLGKKVLVTGGTGFIGSHLVNELIKRGARVTVAGRFPKKKSSYTYVRADLQDFSAALKAMKGSEIVFHLAANAGGRGYIEEYPANCSEGFAVNHNVVKAAYMSGIDRVIFASSACVYPIDYQNNYSTRNLLKEEMAFPHGWAQADTIYGWAKIIGEKILRAYHKQYGLKGAIVRYISVYGPGANDTHAIIALIKRALNKEDPYSIWGTGKQVRDFTYISDAVTATLLAGERITDMSVVNIGTGKRHSIHEVAEIIFSLTKWRPKKIFFDKSKPEGARGRVLNNSRAQKLLGWSPMYDLKKGLVETIKSYRSISRK